MQFTFDGFNRYEIPTLTLCNPNFEELNIIIPAHEPKMSLRFTSISEMEFEVYDNVPYYDLLVKNRLIHMEGFGYWVINGAQRESTGGIEHKTVQCYSYEFMLSLRAVDLSAGTYKFYDPVSPSGTLMQLILNRIPSWSIGTISVSLLSKYRTFDMPDTSVHSFLTNDAAEAYEAIFTFDTQNLTINAYDTTDAVSNTDIVFTWQNLMKEIAITPTDDAIITALDVYGAGDNLGINRVNPLGTNTTYKFDHFASMMSTALWEKVSVWQEAIEAQVNGTTSDTYKALLAQKKVYNDAILTLQAELADVQAMLDSGIQVRDVSMPYSMTSTSSSAVNSIYTWVSANAATCRTLIADASAYPAIDFNSPPTGIASYVAAVAEADMGIAQALVNIHACNITANAIITAISNIQTNIDGVDDEMALINGNLSMSTYFTPTELVELDKYIFGDVYTNEYYVINEDMTASEIQDMAKALYEQGRNALNRISQPNYTFELSAVNFLFCKEYQPFISQLSLGCIVNAEIKEGDWISPILLEIQYDYGAPDDFSMTWGNRYRLQNAEWTWDELNNQVTKTSGAVTGNFSDMIKPVRSGALSEMETFMKSSLDTANNAILAGTNQSMVIDKHGLSGRKITLDSNGDIVYDESGNIVYDDEQLKMINNLLCFTDDNWLSTKTAIGKITVGDLIYYGVNAEIIMGQLVIAEHLTVVNESGNFTVDGNGMSFSTGGGDNDLARILMNPADGFHLQSRSTVSSEWADKIAMSMDGNVTISGELIAVDTVGGWDNEGSTGLQKVGASNFARLGGSSYAFSAGTSQSSPQFSVTYGGALKVTGADISGKITATSGSFTGSITATSAYFNNATVTGTLNASGATWNNGTFNNITASGNITANRIAAYSTITAPSISGGTISGTIISGVSGTFSSLVTGNGNLEVDGTGLTIAGCKLYAYNGALNCNADAFQVESFGCYTLSTSSDADIGGNLYASVPASTGGETVYWGTNTRRFVYHSSSRKYKNTIEGLTDEDILGIERLKPCSFYYNTSEVDMPSTQQYGLIAEEAIQVYPNIIGYKDGEVNSIHYEQLYAPLIAYCQYLNKRLTSLEQLM